MFTISTQRDHDSFGPFGTIVFVGDYELMRKKYIKLIRTYGNIFNWS